MLGMTRSSRGHRSKKTWPQESSISDKGTKFWPANNSNSCPPGGELGEVTKELMASLSLGRLLLNENNKKDCSVLSFHSFKLRKSDLENISVRTRPGWRE
jgi:hypothetical protein